MNEFADIISGMADTVSALHGVAATYTPADGSGVINLESISPTQPLSAVAITESLAAVEYKARDFLVKTCDLSRRGVIITPAQGDKIAEIDPDSGRTIATYTVMQPVEADAPWRWLDRTRRVRRIHTKETVVAA